MNSKSGQPTNTHSFSRREFLITTEEGRKLIEENRVRLSKALV